MSRPSIFKRLSSSLPIASKPTPSKAHHHAPLPSSSFPKGYLLTGVHAGVKKASGVPDLALILSTSPHPTAAAACFTRNAFKAAPVLVSDQVLRANGGWARGVVVNSGCANAVTGKQGLEDAWRMVEETDALLPPAPAPFPPSPSDVSLVGGGGFKHETLVMSTGVIGQNLPIQKIVDGIRGQAPSSPSTTLASDFGAWERAAKAFMTTDTFPKLRSRVFKIGNVEYRLAGMDKGAGMIHPDMGPASTQFGPKPLHATLLGCILTDAAVSPHSLQTALTYAVDRSFNAISVDGDMSTNDSVLLLANGAGVPSTPTTLSPPSYAAHLIDEHATPQAYEAFKNELTAFMEELAKLVVRDGEGATKFVTVSVRGAGGFEAARRVAARVATSALVKTAFFGEDANWGRILAASGAVPLGGLPLGSEGLAQAGAESMVAAIDPSKVSVTICPGDGTSALPVLVNGEPEKVDEARAKEIMVQEEFEVVVDLGGEEGEAKYWTCDFSYEYVRINGDYRS